MVRGVNLMFEAKNLSKNFGGIQAVNKFNCVIDDGEIVGIIGPNGAGKTTVLNLISAITHPDQGEVYLDGKLLNNRKSWEIARGGIARTFQNIRLFQSLDVIGNIMIILSNKKKHANSAQLRKEAKALLEEFGWTDRTDISPASLPYGMQRRVELIRAMALKPRVLMLDEPAAGLNPTEIKELMHYIRMINEKYRIGIIIIEHRLEVIFGLCKRVYVISFGQQIAVGTPDEIQKNKKVIEAYLGVEDDNAGN